MKTKGIKALKVFLFCMTVGILMGLNPISSEAFDKPGNFTVEGKVGIGTDNPQQKLDVDGSIQIKRGNFEGIYFGPGYKGLVWRLYGGGTPAITSNVLAIGTDDAITEIMWDTFRDGAWAFCEGTVSKGAMVDCKDYTGIMGSDDYYWVWKHGKDNRYPNTADLKFIFDGESNDGVMGFMEDEDAFFFDEKLGIGTRNPDAQLNVQGGTDVSLSKPGYIVTGDLSGANIGIDNNEIMARYNGSPSTLYLQADGGTTVLNKNGGNVDIGLSVPGTNAKLDVQSGSINEMTIQAYTNGKRIFMVPSLGDGGYNPLSLSGDAGIFYLTDNNSGGFVLAPWSGSNEGIRIDNSGNVGIGTADPQGYKLYVNGTAYFTGVNQSSDAQFKKNIKPISSALDKVMNLKGVSYEWKTDEYKDRGFEDGRHYGVIAQDVETVLPEIVKENGDGYKGVAYTEMIPVMIEAIKEQQNIIKEQQKIAKQQQQITEKQQKEIKELKAEVNKLKTKDYTASALPQTY